MKHLGKRWRRLESDYGRGWMCRTCGGLLRRSVKSGEESVKDRGLKRVLMDEIQGTCWLFNEGTCRLGMTCKLAHKCALCGGPHRRLNCSGGEEKKAKN